MLDVFSIKTYMFGEIKMYDEGFARRIDIAINKIGGEKVVNAKLNLSAPTLGRWKDGTSDPKMSNMVAFAQAAGVSLDWLLMGVGEITNQVNTTPVASNQSDYEYVRLHDISASAGHGAFPYESNSNRRIAFRKDWLNTKGLHIKNLEAIYARGDSMEPTIPDGATILIDRARNHPIDGKIYVLRIDDALFVKRVQKLPTGGLRLISDNKIYDSLDLSKVELHQDNLVEIIGQVVYLGYDLPD